jgi:hypothetical protein
MIRRYSLAIVGVLLLAAIASAVVRVAPWTQSLPDRVMEQGHGAQVLSEKLITGLGLLVAWALIGFMALGERIGIIQPPKSDILSLFGNESPSPVTPGTASLRKQSAGSPAQPGPPLVR